MEQVTATGLLDLARVGQAIATGNLQWRCHALKMMVERGITRADVFQVLRDGDVIEDYPDDEPYPSGLVLGFVGDRPIHVLVALDDAGPDAYIVTVYQARPDRWEPDWMTRRKR